MLSLSMIVRDEAGQIEDCLKSAQGFVDEMVVVDTGSKDNTMALAEAAGARVEQIEWPGDFAPARNQALAMVQGDWVLVLDADERLKPEAWTPLRALMAQPDVLVINLLRHERGAIQSPYSNVSRLFRRHPRIQWSRAYHSMIDDSVAALLKEEPQWRIADCSEPAIDHDGYRPELLAQGNKPERLRQAMEEELKVRPGDPYACAKLGSLEVAEGNLKRGLALLEEGLKADKEVITATAQVLLDTLADDGNFSKSVRLVTDSASVVVSAMDKFGFSKKDLTLDDLKKEYGEAFVKEHIEVDTTVALNPQVLKDNKLLGELIKLVGEKNFGRFFVKSQTISVAKGFDKVVAGLGKQAREKARNGLIKQAGLSIK